MNKIMSIVVLLGGSILLAFGMFSFVYIAYPYSLYGLLVALIGVYALWLGIELLMKLDNKGESV